MKITITGTSQEIKNLFFNESAEIDVENLKNHIGLNEEVQLRITTESDSSQCKRESDNEYIKRPLLVPKPVVDKLNELYALVEKYPLYIPLPTVATFLGADADGLRSCIEKGQCPFGIGWQKDIRGYKAFKIPTVTFYLWYTQGVGYRQ